MNRLLAATAAFIMPFCAKAEIVTPEMFGAVGYSGVDNTSAIVAWLDNIAEHGNQGVCLKPYEVDTDSLVVPNTAKAGGGIYGNGGDNVKVLPDGTCAFVARNSGSSLFKIGTTTSPQVANFNITGVTFDANGKDISKTVHIVSLSQSVLDSFSIMRNTDVSGTLLYLEKGEDLTFSNWRLTHTKGDLVTLGAPASGVGNNIIKFTGGRGEFFNGCGFRLASGGYMAGLWVDGNKFEYGDNVLGGVTYGSTTRNTCPLFDFSEGTTGNKVANIHMQDNWLQNVHVPSSILAVGDGITGVSFKGNDMRSGSGSVSLFELQGNVQSVEYAENALTAHTGNPTVTYANNSTSRVDFEFPSYPNTPAAYLANMDMQAGHIYDAALTAPAGRISSSEVYWAEDGTSDEPALLWLSSTQYVDRPYGLLEDGNVTLWLYGRKGNAGSSVSLELKDGTTYKSLVTFTSTTGQWVSRTIDLTGIDNLNWTWRNTNASNMEVYVSRWKYE